MKRLNHHKAIISLFAIFTFMIGLFLLKVFSPNDTQPSFEGVQLYSSSAENGHCFIIENKQNSPILTFESKTTYSLFLSVESSIAPKGSYEIHGEYLKLSMSGEADALVFRISKRENSSVMLTYCSELSKSKLLEHIGLGNEIVFSSDVQ